ncbi:hypothetical protein F5Y17DRAFT_413918 [Xylariaceae sp. FL0594]|nr:hypothetical protein F5Y17DRAFT_413918 [Xylariaceae sp. FL0594]
MPPRPALFEFGSRNFVCKSCLSNLRKPPTAPRWPVRQHTSQAATASRPQRTSRTQEQDAERLQTLKALGLLKETDDKPAVNYFDQADNGRLRRLENEEEFQNSLGGDADGTLKSLADKVKGLADVAKALMGARAKKEAEDYDPNGDEVLDESAQRSISLLAIPINGLNGNRQDRIHRLNNWIRRCSRALEKNDLLPKDIQGLWKAYSGARTTMAERWHTVPDPTWDVLWQTLSADYPFNTNRMSQIYALAKDMQQASVTLRPEQQILALEAIFVDGWENEAIENHRRLVSTLGANPDTFVSFWRLGLRMYCRVGDLERAERVATTLLEAPYEVDPRFIFPLIKLCAETPSVVEKGFGLYRSLRDTLGENMTIEDFDTVISYFLASQNTEYALVIFVDMMKSGSVDLLGVHHYPPSIANPFFFGKWLKRLIGAGDLDGAYNVLRFMRSQGITPRAIQVNGLIGAWLRSGTVDYVQNAEDVAWAMINTRVQFVESRRRSSSVPGVNMCPSGDAWPRATLETFSLLAENYRERALTSKMGPLWQSFQEAEIAPDSFMLNQLLWSRIQEGAGDLVIPNYQELVKRFKLKPDSHTFMALWQSLPANRYVKIQQRDLEQETSRIRALFAEMVKHAEIFKTPNGMELDQFLARNVLHTFRKVQDHAGLLLAYRALRRLFQYSPPDMVIFELLIGTLDLQRLAKRREGSKLIRARMTLDHYLAHRQKELVRSGDIEEGEMPPETRAEVTGDFLELQLETALSDKDEEATKTLIIKTAEEMGLNSRTAQDIEDRPVV